MLDIVASYHCMQFQGKQMIQTQENDEKPHFGPDLDSMDTNSVCKFFFLDQSLDIMVNYHRIQYHKKINDPILRKLSEGRTDRRTDKRTRVIS